MKARTQIMHDSERQSRAKRKVGAVDGEQERADPSVIFDLGSPARSDIAQNKDAMIACAFAAGRGKPRMPRRSKRTLAPGE